MPAHGALGPSTTLWRFEPTCAEVQAHVKLSTVQTKAEPQGRVPETPAGTGQLKQWHYPVLVALGHPTDTLRHPGGGHWVNLRFENINVENTE